MDTIINLMPLSIYKRFGLGEVKSTTIKLQLVDGSYIFPRGEIEHVLVKVGKFIFLADFVILHMEEDKDIAHIMGGPCLTIGRAMIDMAARELIMRVNNEQVLFNIFKAMEHLESADGYFEASVIKGTVTEV